MCDFPAVNEKMIDKELGKKMQAVRDLISLGLQQRAENKIKVRQPLANAVINELRYLKLLKDENELKMIIKEELNVKNLDFGSMDQDAEIELDLEITPELKLEGQMRELVRHIQQARKEVGFEVDDRIRVWYSGGSEIFEKYQPEIAKEVLANQINPAKSEDLAADYQKKTKIDGQEIKIWLKKS